MPKVVEPRGRIPGTDSYPSAPLPPFPLPPTHSAERNPISRRVRATRNAPREALVGAPTPPQFFPSEPLRECPPSERRRWDFPAFLDNPACAWLQTLKRLYANPLTFPASLSPRAGLLLHSIVSNVRPKTVIETGTFLGVSTIWMSAALAGVPGAEVHAFDDFGPIHPGPWRVAEMASGRLQAVANTIRDAGLADRVILHPGNSPFELRAFHVELLARGGVQLAFLDGDHGVVGAWQDFWAVEPVLCVGGYVILHDIYPSLCGCPGPRDVVDHIHERAQGRYEHVDLYLRPTNFGLGVMRRIE